MEEQEQQGSSALAQTVSAANELLLQGLQAGSVPSTDESYLDQQIAAYRSSIIDLSNQLQLIPAVAAGDDDHLQQEQVQQQQQQQDQLQHCSSQLPPQPPDPTAVLLPGLGQEGIDYTVETADELDPSEWQVPPHCIPIHANVTTFDWSRLYNMTSFDVVMMDPPWQLATANPTRGVALGYSQLADHDIRQLPVPKLQLAGGFLFVWVINSKYKFTLDLFQEWGYTLVDEVVWVKVTVNRRLAKSHGYYLQHAKEVCMVARKNADSSSSSSDDQAAEAAVGGPAGGGPHCKGVGSDVIISERRGQSQKPEEIYDLIEQLVPGGRYLEIFARKNNLRNFWVSIGNEVTGTGLPEEDVEAFMASNSIPGAVYGRGGGSSGAAAAAGAAG